MIINDRSEGHLNATRHQFNSYEANAQSKNHK
jgi:hypothetical protein